MGHTPSCKIELKDLPEIPSSFRQFQKEIVRQTLIAASTVMIDVSHHKSILKTIESTLCDAPRGSYMLFRSKTNNLVVITSDSKLLFALRSIKRCKIQKKS